MSPKVSIIVPCWGVEKYLDRCVESLVHQTLREIEIILVDDESPDRVPQMCDEWALRDPRIKVIHKKNGGIGMACNSGIEKATGEFVAFCDSDDWVEPDMYERLCAVAREYNAQGVYSGIRQVYDNGIVRPLSMAAEMKVCDTPQKIDGFMSGMVANVPSAVIDRLTPMSAKVVLYSRAVLEQNRIRFESERQYISEDLVFNLDFLSHCSCVVEVPQIYYNYFVNTRSISNKVRVDRFERALVLHDLVRTRYPQMSDEFYIRTDRLFTSYARVAICQICTASSIPFWRRLSLVRGICRHPRWAEVQKRYPISQMPVSHRLFFLATRYGVVSLIFLMSYIRSKTNA